ncbi:MAG TPA: RNA polymerase factor sigma-54 [Hyphomicrobiaceae bacterium]|nr:RNA polymerase factor sigma-54 [Hyphomicrobiaceae bacterium]
MALSQRLELRQGQQLVMTPQLQQAIRLLQLSNIELNAFVEAELERNPLLEREEGTPAAQAEPHSAAEGPPNGAEAEVFDPSKPALDVSEMLDTDLDNVYPDAAPEEFGATQGLGGWASLRPRAHNADADDFNLEEYVASNVSLRDHLTEQMHLAVTDPVERIVAQHLIDLVDEAGYLAADLGSVADKLGASGELVERVLSVLQSFDPPGVCARSLSECLALQLKDQDRFDPQIARLLDNLELLAAHDLSRLRKAVGVDADELADMIAEIKRLSPKPGLKFGSVQVQPVVPDILVRPAPDGSWIVELNSETLPRVLVNRSYYTKVSKTARSEKDRSYLLDCLQSANWLVKSLDQRARTILRVGEEIVRQQDAFLTYGVRHLRPLNLRMIAEAISMHESTISRVTSNKYMATPRGIFELKYFFTSAIPSSGSGEAHSSETVRFLIKQLIDAETSSSVLSDESIAEKLRQEGIDIARRTIAKYREGMRIPSSAQRRREKRLTRRTNA